MLLERKNLLISMMKELEKYEGLFEKIMINDELLIPAKLFLVLGPEFELAYDTTTGEYKNVYQKFALKNKDGDIENISVKKVRENKGWSYEKKDLNLPELISPIEYFKKWSDNLNIEEVYEINDLFEIDEIIEELEDVLSFYKDLSLSSK